MSLVSRVASFVCVASAVWAGAAVASSLRRPDEFPIETNWIARVLQDGKPRGCATLVRDRRTVVTCDHVLTQSDECILEYPGPTSIHAVVAERGEADDVAILRLDADAPARPRPLATEMPSSGTTLHLCTRWGGATQPTPATVAAPARAVWPIPDLDEYQECLMLDTETRPGTSGSAWVDERGFVVAIVEGRIAGARVAATTATPAARIRERLAHDAPARGSLRIELWPTSLITPDPSAQRRDPPGLKFVSMKMPPAVLHPGAALDQRPAEDRATKVAWERECPMLNANVPPGAVITAIDGKPATTLEDWWERITIRPPGTSVSLRYVWGDGSPVVLDVRVVTVPALPRPR